MSACKGHSAGIYTVAFSPDGQTLASGGFDGQVRLCKVSTGQLAKAFIPVPITSVPIRPAVASLGNEK